MLPTREFADGHRHQQCISLGIMDAWNAAGPDALLDWCEETIADE
jgi:hypothetical protein